MMRAMCVRRRGAALLAHNSIFTPPRDDLRKLFPIPRKLFQPNARGAD
jgi:hypothetical protein